MKFKHLFIMGFGIGLQSITNIQAQTPVIPTVGKNSIVTFTPVDPVKTIETLKTLNVEKQGVTIQYFDGLGRPEQTVSIKSTPDLKDLIQPIEYDEYGRESTKYLPYEAQYGNYGTYRDKTTWQTDQANFYNTLYTDEGPFAKSFTDFEKSPLNRVLKQLNPGKDWADSQKYTTYNYGTNIAGDVRYYTVTEDNTLFFDGFYGEGKLVLLETTDEDGRTVQEYKDFSGQVILKRTFTDINKGGSKVETYYVYDDMGRLRYVVPPLAAAEHINGQEIQCLAESKTLTAPDQYTNTFIAEEGASITLQAGFTFKAQAGTTFTAKATSGLMFYYEYDERGRVTMKKIPGASPVYMAYDQLDRLVLEQDGELRKNNQWIGHTYDAYGREIKSGLVVLGVPNSQADAQTWFNTNTNAIDTKIAAGTLLAQNWYDNYTTLPSTFSALAYLKLDHLSMPNAASSRTIGQTTATEVKVLNPESGKRSTLKTKTYYDEKGRMLQMILELYDGGYLRQSYGYDWKGTILNEEVRVENCPLGNITLERRIGYDHTGRVIAIEQRVNSGDWIKVTENGYNALGQNIARKLGIDATTVVQEINYTYNIRGWLTAINNPDNLGNDLFAMKLNYQKQNTVPVISGDPTLPIAQFAGNITEMDIAYRDANPGNINRTAYRFIYDGLNRLIKGMWYSNNGTTWSRDNSKYDTKYSYDINGNIKTLSRYGITDATNELIDNLDYRYEGNRLVGVTDNSTKAEGYADNNKTTTDYLYNANGSMTKDLDKGITVTYNILNLLQQVKETSGQLAVNYVYTATGTKLASLYQNNGLTQGGNRYIGPVVYNYDFSTNSWRPDYIPTAEGRLSYGEGNWVQQYFLTDHLGNIRSIVEKNSSYSTVTGYARQIWQQNYYPFGMKLGASYLGTTNKLCYNGKEEQDYALNGKNLEWLDYSARMYNSALAKWMNVDPLLERSRRWSPYNFAYNNPIRFIDPDGMQPYEFQYNIETQNMVQVGTAGGANFHSVAIVDNEGNTNETFYIKGSSVKVKQEGSNVTVSGDFVPTYDSEGQETGYSNQSQNYYGAESIADAAKQASNELSMTENSPNYWLGNALPFAATASAVDGPLPIGEIIGASILTVAGLHDLTAKIVHANSKSSQKPNIVYEIYSITSTGNIQTMKYGVSSRSDFITRSGNPRPEYQCVALNATSPPGIFFWYSILARTPDRNTALRIEKSYVDSYIRIHGVRPPLQIRP